MNKTGIDHPCFSQFQYLNLQSRPSTATAPAYHESHRSRAPAFSTAFSTKPLLRAVFEPSAVLQLSSRYNEMDILLQRSPGNGLVRFRGSPTGRGISTMAFQRLLF